MRYTSLINFLLLFTDIKAIIRSQYMGLYIPNMTRSYYSIPLLIIIFIALSGCKMVDTQSTVYPTQQQQNHILEERLAAYTALEEALAIREAEISAREKELVDLYAEFVKEKKALAASRANQIASEKNDAANQKIQQTIPNRKINQDPNNNRIILGEIENVFLDPPGMEFKARIDTGAQTSSLNAVDKVEFERDGKPFVKFHIIDPNSGEKIELTRRIRGYVRIKQHKTKSQRRPIVQFRVKLGDIDEQISFTLTNRSKYKKQVLLGRNFLRDLAIVDVSKKHSIPSIEPKVSEPK